MEQFILEHRNEAFLKNFFIKFENSDVECEEDCECECQCEGCLRRLDYTDSFTSYFKASIYAKNCTIFKFLIAWDKKLSLRQYKQVIPNVLMDVFYGRSFNETLTEQHLEILQFVFDLRPKDFFNVNFAAEFWAFFLTHIRCSREARDVFFDKGIKKVLINAFFYKFKLNDFYEKIIYIYADMTFEEHQKVTSFIMSYNITSQDDFMQRVEVMETHPSHPWITMEGNTFLHMLCKGYHDNAYYIFYLFSYNRLL